MNIKAEKVERCEDGYWTHSQYPNIGDDESKYHARFNIWLDDNNLSYYCLFFQDDASEDLVDRYFEEDDSCACKEWEPEIENKEAFLLSVHDSEDGPVALFVFPKTSLVDGKVGSDE